MSYRQDPSTSVVWASTRAMKIDVLIEGEIIDKVVL